MHDHVAESSVYSNNSENDLISVFYQQVANFKI